MRCLMLVVLVGAYTSASAPAPAPGPAPQPMVAVAPEPEPEPEPEPAPELEPEPEPEHEHEHEPAIAATPGYAPTGTDVLLVREVLQAIDDIARVMESNQDCDRMVDGLEIVATRIRPLISRAKEIEKQKARSEWFKQQLEAQATTFANRMIAPFQRCAQNKRLLALMERLGS